MKIKQKTLEQTGVCILSNKREEGFKVIPLYSLNIIEEANSIATELDSFIEAVYASNNLMEKKIEDIIEEYMKTSLNLPEDYMEELLSGFPYIKGLATWEELSLKQFYA